MLTKKQIGMIAAELKLEKPMYWDTETTYQWERDVRAVAHALKVLSPNLDLQEFYKDCTLVHPTNNSLT